MTFGLDGYIDESERKEATEPVSVAGYIFKPAAYRAFCREWKRMLMSGPKPTTHFHMTNLYARDKQYKGWSVTERADYLRLAVNAARRYKFCVFWGLFIRSEFESLERRHWQFASS